VTPEARNGLAELPAQPRPPSSHLGIRVLRLPLCAEDPTILEGYSRSHGAATLLTDYVYMPGQLPTP
jgi:hypothetical protein